MRMLEIQYYGNPPRQWGLNVGNQVDYVELASKIERDPALAEQWSIVHAAKEPHHREMLGYTGRAAPKDHAEYLFGYRGNRLVLNLVDVDDPAYVNVSVIDAAVDFIHLHINEKRNVLVHCNVGQSRSPTIAMLYLTSQGLLPPADFEFAEAEFKRSYYPNYAPARGMREFARSNWQRYSSRADAL